MEEQKEIALVYMVAGISSRFGGKIKAFAQVGPNNESLLEYSLNQALPAGFNKIVLIVGEKTEQPFLQKFGREYNGIPIDYVKQIFDKDTRDKPWGTTDAICCAKDVLDGPFVVCNGDDIYGDQVFKVLYDHLKEKSTDATVGYKLGTVLSPNGGVNRGIFKVNQENQIISLEEKFDLSYANLQEKGITIEDLCSMNIFAFQKRTLDALCEVVKNFRTQYGSDRKIECLLPQEIGYLIKSNQITMKLYPTDEQWYGLTRPEDVGIVKKQLELKKY